MGNFYDSQENKDIRYLNDFNEKYKWFVGITSTPKYTGWDAECTDKSGNTVIIEMKERDRDYPQGTFIEPKKVHHLQQFADNGDRALYINFYSGGTVARIFSFTTLPSMHLRKDVRIWDRGAREFKTEDRYIINNEDGKLFRL